MPDDPIRDLLAKVATHTMGLPLDQVAAPFGHIEANGGDVEAIRVWVEARDGYVENPLPPPQTSVNPQPRPNTDRRRFVFPASALGPQP